MFHGKCLRTLLLQFFVFFSQGVNDDTRIELMIAITIIDILAAIAIPGFKPPQE